MPLRSANPDPKQLTRLIPSLPVACLDELIRNARQVTYRPGEAVMGEGARWTPAIVTEGLLRLSIRSRDGREATLRLVGRGMVLGLVAMFEPDYSSDLHQRSVVAVERSSLIFLDSGQLMRACQKYPELSLDLLRGVVEWSGALVDAAAQFAFMSVRERLADRLLGLAAEDRDGRLVASATQQQLANSIGSVREVVARTLHELRKEGVVEVERARVIVVDRDSLARSALRVT